MKDICCGIDLGTTNSVIARLDRGIPNALSIEEGRAIVPSVVSFDPENGQVYFGAQALNRLVAFPNHTIKSVKRLMGKDTPIIVGGKSYLPEEISGMLLGHLAQKASKILGEEVRKVVITVPAYFDDAQRKATIRAGELAGLEVMRIINEPTAASLVYEGPASTSAATEETMMVYDLGGGTFDVSILHLRGDVKEVLASCGDTALGGDDFDERLKDHFLGHLKEKWGTDFSHDFALQVRLKEIAERTKIALSDTPFVQVQELGVTVLGNDPVNLVLEVGRRELEDMTHDLLMKTHEKIHDALKEAKLTAEEIDKIVLVGGSTRMPAVQEMLSEVFDQPIEHSIDPDLCVALGAAVQSGIITGEPISQILIDVAAHSLGVRTVDEIDPRTGEPDYFSSIIRRNTRIPVTRSEVYYTLVPNQEKILVDVYQGESLSCRENTFVSSFAFPLKSVPENSPITIEFSYDLQGIVNVTVNQKGYENKKTVAVNLKAPAGEAATEMEELSEKPVNYVSQKARQFLSDPGISTETRKELMSLIQEYEAAVVGGNDADLVDDLEDRLLEMIDKLEEDQEDIG